MATESGRWELAVCAFIEYRNRKLKKSKLKRAEALEIRKALVEEINGLNDSEKTKRSKLMCDYYEVDRQIEALRLTIGECHKDIGQAIDHADQPSLFPLKPHGDLDIPDEEPAEDDDDEKQPELIEGAGPKGKSKRADLQIAN